MTISPELQQETLRLFHAEKWRPGTIAHQLGVHYSTVKRVLEQEGVPPAKIIRPTKVDPYLPFIGATLEEYPTLTAARLYAMVQERGYTGKPSHFRDIVSRIRPSEPRSSGGSATKFPSTRYCGRSACRRNSERATCGSCARCVMTSTRPPIHVRISLVASAARELQPHRLDHDRRSSLIPRSCRTTRRVPTAVHAHRQIGTVPDRR